MFGLLIKHHLDAIVIQELMRHHCGTDYRVAQRASMNPWKPEVRPGACEESATRPLE